MRLEKDEKRFIRKIKCTLCFKLVCAKLRGVPWSVAEACL